MPKPKIFVSPRKLPNIFRPTREPQRSSKHDLSDMSENAKKLWEKNEMIMSYELDVNKNKITVDHRRNSSENLERPSSLGVTEIAEELLSQLLDSMGKIIFLAQNDPSLLKVCFEIIENQRKTDNFISRLDKDFIPVLERPLQWELKCLEELGKFPGTRLKDLPKLTEENTAALFLHQIMETVSSDLTVIKTFVDDFQQSDDYVFRNVAVAYKNHLYRLMDDLYNAAALDDKQMNSILLFLGEFRQKFPKSHFVDFWRQEKEEKDELSIISVDKYEDLINRYLDRQSTVVCDHLSRCLGIEIKLWLSGNEIEAYSSTFKTTQWPVDVVDLCDQNLKVSKSIDSEVYQRMHQLLHTELTNAVKLYGDAAKYYIKPCKLTTCSKCPELVSLKKERRKDSPAHFNQQTTLAILNNFSLLDKHLTALSEKYVTDESIMEGFKRLKNIMKGQATECLEHYKSAIFHPTMKGYSKQLMTKEWFPDSSITEEFCDVISTFICALDCHYFTGWQEDVRLMVHYVYLKAMCKTCKYLKCESDDERQKVAKRLNLEKRRLEDTFNKAIPLNQAEYIQLLKQVADVIESTDELSCQTSVTILKLQQKEIITKKQLAAILTIHGGFKSKNKRIIGSLYRQET